MFEKKRFISKKDINANLETLEIRGEIIETLKVAYDAVAKPAIVANQNGMIVVFNRECQCLTGFDSTLIEGRSFDQLPFASSPSTLRRDGKFVSNWFALDGSMVSIQWEISAINLTSEKFTLHLGTIESGDSEKTDPVSPANGITDLANSKAKIEETNQILETILESLHDVVFVKDYAGRITFFRWSYLDGFGKNDISHLGKTVFELETEPQASMIEACRIECQTTGKPCSYIKHVNLDGKNFDFRVVVSPTRNPKGEITGVIGVGRDVTEQLAAQSKAEELENRLSNIASTITDIIFQTENNIIKYVSPSASLYGHDPERLTGKNISELFGSDFLKYSIESGTHGFEIETIDANHIRHDFEVRLIKSQNGIMGIARNVSERKNFEKAKKHFLRSVAHEMRNPLTLILGYSELLMSITTNDTNIHNMAQIINDAAESEKKRLNEFFDLDKATIEYNFEISGISNALGSLCTKLLMLVSKTARNRYNSDQASFSHTIDPALRGKSMSLDFGRFSEIFENLAINSVKYSPKDRLEINCDALLVGNSLEIRFSDKGIGIPENELDDIFKPFHQVKHGGKELEGLGLGLANVLMHVEAHGGSISVESKVDQGTTFILTFPLFM